MCRAYVFKCSHITLIWVAVVAQLTEKRKESCRGKPQEYSFPAMDDFVDKFSRILQDIDSEEPNWNVDASIHLNQLADEVRSAKVVSSCIRS